MRKRQYVLGLFFCLALIQIAVPVSMIIRREITLRHGLQFRFRTAPVDPYDAFRGRYIALRIENNKFPIAEEGVELIRNQKVYAYIKEDDKGFAKIVSVSVERPDGDVYLQTRVRYMVNDKEVSLNFPFDRYYIDEKLAPVAESAYFRHSQRNSHDAYITVRVKSGFGVLEELYIGDKPVLEFIKEKH